MGPEKGSSKLNDSVKSPDVANSPQNDVVIKEDCSFKCEDPQLESEDAPVAERLEDLPDGVEKNKCDVLLTDQVGEEDCSLAEDFSLDEEDFSLEADKVLEGLVHQQTVYREADELSDDYSSSDDESVTDPDDEYRACRLPNAHAQFKNVQLLKLRGSDGKIKLTQLPPGLQITKVPESAEERMAREREYARRKEEAIACGMTTASPIKRKHSERMALEEVRRDDFEDSQDYVDYLQSKLKNISIKQCK